MYKIAICDDEKSSAADAAELLEKYRQTHYKVEMSVDIFYTSLDLLGAIEKESYDIYLLDIYIDKMNGIEIAEAIRKIDENGQIIFMTSSNAFYKDAFRRVCAKEEVRFLSFRESGQVHKIPVDEILYIESEDHYKRIVTEADSFFVRNTMQNLLQDLKEEYFHALGMKTIINLKRVLRINKDVITMEDGATFSVPRGTYRQLSELILKFSF